MPQRLDIVLAVPGLPFNGETVRTQSLGGSESAGYYVARELAARGHNVTCFTHGDEGEWDNVQYLKFDKFAGFVAYTRHDLCVVQRMPLAFQQRNAAKLNWIWCHDLALKRQENEFKAPMWNVDRVLVLSDFMRQQYQNTYGLPEHIFLQTRNGVDLALVEEAKASLEAKRQRALNDPDGGARFKRNPRRIVFAARPERGLDVLLEQIMPELLKRVPDAKLALCAYANTVDHLAEFYAACAQAARALGPDVVEERGALTKRELYELYLTSGCYAYPTPSPLIPNFAEVSCISAMEAMACGLPIVCSDRGALKETIGGPAGKLVAGLPGAAAYTRDFVDRLAMLLTDARANDYAASAGLKRAQQLSWREVAEQWAEEAERQIREKSADKVSLGWHFYRRSDIVALKALLKAETDDGGALAPGLAELGHLVDEHYGFMDAPEGYREQYEKIGATHDDRVIGWAAGESRFATLKGWLERNTAARTVLDYGCAHGAYAVNLAQQIPDLRILGVDIDHHGIEIAGRFAVERAVNDRTHFEVATHEALPYANALTGGGIDIEVDHEKQEMSFSAQRLFDAVIAQEVLEHVPEPWAVLEKLWERVKPGGWLYVTVPYGAWEYESYHTYPHRAHIWELDPQDWRDMLKGFEKVHIAALPEMASNLSGDALGWLVIYLQKTEKNAALTPQPVNLERKLWLQAPRQSVSVNMMGGPGIEETLHWCLRSVQGIADQIVLVNTGMNAEALRIAEQYRQHHGLVLVPGPDPKTAGFETPRNLGLEHCFGHWVMWIDTDEKLVRTPMLAKYLRENLLDGYSIRQNHFAVDTKFDPDLPVRIFRKRTGNRWFGMIHEHPERELNAGPGLSVVLPDVHIAHVGYLAEDGRQLRFIRNFPLLQADIKKYPERLLQKCFVMRDNMIRVHHDIRMKGGRVGEEHRALARETIELYRQYFLTKSYSLSTDPIEYYTQAVRLLGIGFEAGLSVGASTTPEGVRLDSALYARFATMEDYMAEVEKRARETAGGLTHEYF